MKLQRGIWVVIFARLQFACAYAYECVCVCMSCVIVVCAELWSHWFHSCRLDAATIRMCAPVQTHGVKYSHARELEPLAFLNGSSSAAPAVVPPVALKSALRPADQRQSQQYVAFSHHKQTQASSAVSSPLLLRQGLTCAPDTSSPREVATPTTSVR